MAPIDIDPSLAEKETSKEAGAQVSWWLLFPEGPIAALLAAIAPAWAMSLALESQYARAALVLIGTWGLAFVAVKAILAERKGVAYMAVLGILAIAGFVAELFT